MTVAAVVLAAGAGSRFDGDAHKLLADLRGRPVVEWAVRAALGGALDEVIVVTGAVALDGIVAAGVRLVDNPRWREGISTSLRAGVAAADERGHEAAVIGLGDQPFIKAAAWTRVAAAAHAPIVAATYDGKRRNPVRLHRSIWPLLPETGDEGARLLMRGRPDLVGEVACEGMAADIDTMEDLTRWS